MLDFDFKINIDLLHFKAIKLSLLNQPFLTNQRVYRLFVTENPSQNICHTYKFVTLYYLSHIQIRQIILFVTHTNSSHIICHTYKFVTLYCLSHIQIRHIILFVAYALATLCLIRCLMITYFIFTTQIRFMHRVKVHFLMFTCLC